MIRRSDSIKKFLEMSTHADLAALYRREMEVQVLVSEDGGTRVDKEFHGRAWHSYTDGIQTWQTFRIPRNAWANPEDNDFEMTYDLSKYALGIGMTGWDWINKRSIWCAYDFDAITGHSDKHKKKLDVNELEKLIELVKAIPWVTLRKSTGGKGLHLYVFMGICVETINHNEHMALGRGILAMLSELACFDFQSKVDTTASNMWVWHRKMKGTDGLTLLKQGTELTEIPHHWKDHLDVINGKSRKIVPFFIKESANAEELERIFEELSGTSKRVPLDAEHNRLLTYLRENTKGGSWWDNDHWMLVTHTYHLRQAHQALKLRGFFDTIATGKEAGADWNCFAYPMRNGGWSVRRYTPGCAEHPSWAQDGKSWTKCYYNLIPDLNVACRAFGGIERPAGGYVFKHFETALQVLSMLGLRLEKTPDWLNNRGTLIKKHKDGRLVVEVNREERDAGNEVEQWVNEGKHWKRIFDFDVTPTVADEAPNFDQFVRHVITENDENAGWMVKTQDGWQLEPKDHIKDVLTGVLKLKDKDVKTVMGSAVMASWKLVNKPLEPEYPSDRQWNRNAAQLKYTPSPNIDSLNYPTWTKILNHLGRNLDDAVQNWQWAKQHGLKNGADYLKLWIASLFQKPLEPLPYLFFYSQEQNTGKSTFHESIAHLLTRGVVRADNSLFEQSQFNGELLNAILCVVEETDLNTKRTGSKITYNKIKDWVTARQLPIHVKLKTPFTIPNSTHWVQCSNDRNSCPVFQGDSRIVVIRVNVIPTEELIPRIQLEDLIQKEAPDFLAEVLRIDIPPSNDRLAVPVLQTEDKRRIQESNMNPFELFLKECCHYVPGSTIPWQTLYQKFFEQLDSQYTEQWTKIFTGKHIPPQFPKARYGNDHSQWHIGNISFHPPKPGDPIKPRLVIRNDFLVPEREVDARNGHASQSVQEGKEILRDGQPVGQNQGQVSQQPSQSSPPSESDQPKP